MTNSIPGFRSAIQKRIRTSLSLSLLLLGRRGRECRTPPSRLPVSRSKTQRICPASGTYLCSRALCERFPLSSARFWSPARHRNITRTRHAVVHNVRKGGWLWAVKETGEQGYIPAAFVRKMRRLAGFKHAVRSLCRKELRQMRGERCNRVTPFRTVNV